MPPPPWFAASGLFAEGVRLREKSGEAHSEPAMLLGLSLTPDIDGLRLSSWLRSRNIAAAATGGHTRWPLEMCDVCLASTYT